MPSEPLRPLGGVERHVLEQIRVKRRQQPLECPRDQVISRTRSEPIRIGHGGTLLRQIPDQRLIRV